MNQEPCSITRRYQQSVSDGDENETWFPRFHEQNVRSNCMCVKCIIILRVPVSRKILKTSYLNRKILKNIGLSVGLAAIQFSFTPGSSVFKDLPLLVGISHLRRVSTGGASVCEGSYWTAWAGSRLLVMKRMLEIPVTRAGSTIAQSLKSCPEFAITHRGYRGSQSLPCWRIHASFTHWEISNLQVNIWKFTCIAA